jgi:hypothetical protein
MYFKAELTSLISPPQVLDLSGAALFNFCCERLLYVCLQCSKPFRTGAFDTSAIGTLQELGALTKVQALSPWKIQICPF